MLRSATAVNILNYDNADAERTRRTPVLLLVSVAIVEFLLSSIFFCYAGSFLEFSVTKFYNYHKTLWVVVVFIAAQNISETITKCLYEYYINVPFNRLYLILAALLLQAALYMSATTNSLNIYILTYGLLGGTLSQFITIYIQELLEDEYDININVYQSIIQISRAISMFTMPVLVVYLDEIYGTKYTPLIFTAIIGNIIPFCLFFKRSQQWISQKPTHYSNMTNMSVSMTELSVFHTNNNNAQSESTKNTSSSASTSDDEDPDVTWQEEEYEETYLTNDELDKIKQEYYAKHFGVNILPRIREESESEEISSKRLSQITAKLEEINKNDPKFANRQFTSDVLLPEIKTGQSHNTIDIDFPDGPVFRRGQCGCSPYRKYLWKRRWRNFTRFLIYNFFVPFYRTVVNPKFYPVLVTKSSTSLIFGCFVNLIPVIACEKLHTFERVEAVFLLSYMAFSWCFFLIFLPVVTKLSNVKIRVLYITGSCMLSSVMLYLSQREINNDAITLGSLLFGFGYGITSYTETIIYREFFGMRHWQECRGTLNTLSGISIVTCYFFIYHYKVDYQDIINYSSFVYLTNIIIWVFCPILKSCFKFIKRTLWYKKQEALFVTI